MFEPLTFYCMSCLTKIHITKLQANLIRLILLNENVHCDPVGCHAKTSENDRSNIDFH